MADNPMPFGLAPIMAQKDQPPFRPLNPGEQIGNPDGSYSTEVTITVDDGNGGYMVIPQLYMGPRGLIDLRGNEQAASNAARMLRDRYGLQFPTFRDLNEANAFASQRSQMGGAGQGPIYKR